MSEIVRIISLIAWIIGIVLLVLALVPSIGGGGGPDKLIVAGVLFLCSMAGMSVSGVAGGVSFQSRK
ncbi:MAG: hypothetical protein ACYDBJ_26800 [Aggregatilineales bacterium]